MTPPQEPTLYDELGGPDGIETVVAGLYERTMADATLAPFFTGHSLESIVAHQRLLLAAALGGPAEYQGRTLREAHQDLAIEPVHVDALIGHLVESLETAGAAPSVVDRVTAVVARLWFAQRWPDGADDDDDNNDNDES